MATIIEFPRAAQPVLWKFTSSGGRVMHALRFLFRNFQHLPARPRKMFVMYEVEDSESVYYLNIGYDNTAFLNAFGEVMQDIDRRPENWET